MEQPCPNPKSLSRRARGFLYERRACRYLKTQGLRLIEQNFNCPLGEIDLIMQDKNCLVFVEVRYRKNPDPVSSLESIGFRKQQRLSKTALYYLKQHKLSTQPCRFDVVGFDGLKLQWIKRAF